MTERTHAVVLGGSMAGLLAARVLAETYAAVTVVDRDDLGVPDAERRGVPQGRHAHVLLARGQEALEELFPGLTDELVASGVPHGEFLVDTRLYFSGHLLRRAPTGLAMLCASRPFLERRVRARVRELSNVSFAPPCDIVGLAATPDARRITGARVFRRADGSVAETIGADLVVDATGRGSRTPRWLEELGYAPPAEERVEIDVSYATALFRLPADALDGDLGCLQGPTPDFPAGGAFNRLEGGRWLLTLAGVVGRRPPTDPDGFMDYAKSLRFPDIHEAISGAEPIDGPVPYRFPANVRRRYERLARLPDGLVVVGDGVCTFNPIYGQGMTVAAMEALALRSHLLANTDPGPRLFQRELARVIDTPWEMAIGSDLGFPAARGRRTRKLRILGRYVARLHAAAAHDAGLARTFARVSGLVDPPGALLRPGVMARVLRHGRRLPGTG